MTKIGWNVALAGGTFEVFTPWRDERGMFVIVPMDIVDSNLQGAEIEVESEAKPPRPGPDGYLLHNRARDRPAPIPIAPGGYLGVDD